MSGSRTGERPDHNPPIVAHCGPCAKWSYRTRRDARRGANRERGRFGHMQPYPCPETPGGQPDLWHIGHLPGDVSNGTLDKDDYVAKVAAKRARR